MTDDAKPAAIEPIVVECDLDDPPDKVWRALKEPELLAAWLMPDALHSQDGGPHRLAFGAERCVVELEALSEEPHRHLRYRWSAVEREGDAAARRLDSIVTFDLAETDSGGTHLRIVHDGFRLAMGASVPFARRRAAYRPRPRRRPRDMSMRLAA